jgi:hypothetical protein
MSEPPILQPTLWRTCRVLANRNRLQLLELLIEEPSQTVSLLAKRLRLSAKLEARGFVTQKAGRYAAVERADALGRELARLAMM